MTCKSLDPEMLAAWVDGGLDKEAARDVACHVANCPNCQNTATALRAETDALRQALGRDRAPAHLWGRIASQLVDAPVPPKRFAAWKHLQQRVSKPLLGTMLAASLLFGVLVPHLPDFGATPDVTLSTLAAETTQDYVTFQISQRGLDVVSDDPVETLTWLASRLDVALPEMAEDVLDYRLAGGRLCWLMGQRLGALTYSRGSDRMTVYLMPAPFSNNFDRKLRKKSHTAQHVKGPVRSIVWSEHHLAIAIVSDLPDSEKFRFAEAFRRTLNDHFLGI
ncbi:MAG: anti-sigma factor family protein [Rhodobacterales bacterium]